MLEHDLFDRGGIDIVTTADYEILGAAGNPEKAVLIEAPEIAGIDPVAVNERALVMRVVEIAAEHAGARHDHDADLVCRAVAHQAILGVEFDDAHAAVGQGQADGAETDRTIRI